MRGFFIVVAALISVAVQAEPVVLHDSGQTEPLAPYLASVQVEPTDSAATAAPPSGYNLAALFPIRTPSMTPGPVWLSPDQQARLRGLPRPLFLLGADSLSRAWLVEQRGQLEAVGAVGFLVNAESLAELSALQQLAGPGLIIVPASAETLAQVLGLRHYPLLLTPFPPETPEAQP